jgi:hypothetical protein
MSTSSVNGRPHQEPPVSALPTDRDDASAAPPFQYGLASTGPRKQRDGR